MLRRDFLKLISALAVLWSTEPDMLFASAPGRIDKRASVGKDSLATIYRSVNGSPRENLIKVVEMMGGIEKYVESDAVVIIKPNVQWRNQGASNLSVVKTLVDLIMNRPSGFKGEVVVAENCHRGLTPWKSNSSGWLSSFERNSDVPHVTNMTELCALLKKQYGSCFSNIHWIDVVAGAKRVFSPKDGEGYIYCDGSGGVPLIKCDNGAQGKDFRSTIMTYPIFSTDNGSVIDFKDGVWEKGAYTRQPLRFINLAALNHHSAACGATSAVKNYLGITDLSGGSDVSIAGRLPGQYFNFHSFMFNGSKPGPVPGMLGKEVGVFMNSIRKADINITAAEWVGLSSRTNPPVAHTRAVLASTDPVALDYHATKYVLYPNSKVAIHNPDNKESPLHHYLLECSKANGGIFDEKSISVVSYDFKKKQIREGGEQVVKGKVEWGNNTRDIMKYLYFRHFV